MTARNWLVLAGSLSAGLCLFAGTVDYLVDPWGLNGSVSIKGFNEFKPDPITIARLHKAYGVVRVKANALVLGTSAAEHGIDLRHWTWRKFESSYNMGIPGASIEEIKNFLEAAHRLRPIKHATIGLELSSFNANRRAPAQIGQAFKAIQSTMYRTTLYFTRSMLIASLDTILRQPSLFAYFLPNGQSSPKAFEQWKEKSNGHHNLMTLSGRQSVRAFLPAPKFAFEFQQGSEKSTLAQFAELIEFGRQEGIDMLIFISPCHAWQLETIRAMGLWSVFEYWKQQLARIVDPYTNGKAGEAQIALWDFADYSSVTAEEVPPANDAHSQMQWFWDAQHYTTRLGDSIQDRMLRLQKGNTNLADGFGVSINANNIDAHLFAIRERREQYQKSHLHDVVEIERNVAITLKALGLRPSD